MQVLLNMLFEFIHCVLVILDDLWVLQLLICSYDSVGEMGANLSYCSAPSVAEGYQISIDV